MALSERDLLDGFGGAAEAGNAALFVGAGLSLNAGYPTWNALLAQPRDRAQIPAGLTDLPLVAQYVEQNIPGGREALEGHILSSMKVSTGQVSVGHALLTELPVDEFWTTNYDNLIEQAFQKISVVSRDDDLTNRRTLGRRRVMKMHGSVSHDNSSWTSPPVITRSDYEHYESKHPRLWAALRATYLTRSMLFLGFSFTDPNIDILLRLSRTLNIGAPEHFTVLRRPSDETAARLHDLHCNDLEQSGVAVYEVADFDELAPILSRLVRRTRQKVLFVSGGKSDDSQIAPYAPALGAKLAELDLDIASLAGKSAMRVSYSFGHYLKSVDNYAPERVRFFFREKPGAAPPLDERIGTAVYTALNQADLRRFVIDLCRAVVLIGGGSGTEEEAALAKEIGVPVIPLACSKGAAYRVWEKTSVKDSGITLSDSGDETRDWNLLNNPDASIAVGAACRLIVRAMYLGGHE